MIAAVDILTIVNEVLKQGLSLGNLLPLILSYSPILFMVAFALQRKPHKFAVLLYIRAIMSLFSYILRTFIVLFSAFSEYSAFSASTSENITREPGEIAVNLLLSSLVLLPYVALSFLCARAISKQKNGEDGFNKAFVIAAFVITAIGFVSYCISAKGISIGNILVTVEAVLLILVVKYVEEKHKAVSDGLRNYPSPEEMSEDE